MTKQLHVKADDGDAQPILVFFGMLMVITAIGLIYVHFICPTKPQPWGPDNRPTISTCAAIVLSLISVGYSVALLLCRATEQDDTNVLCTSMHDAFITFEEYSKDNEENERLLEKQDEQQFYTNDEFVYSDKGYAGNGTIHHGTKFLLDQLANRRKHTRISTTSRPNVASSCFQESNTQSSFNYQRGRPNEQSKPSTVNNAHAAPSLGVVQTWVNDECLRQEDSALITNLCTTPGDVGEIMSCEPPGHECSASEPGSQMDVGNTAKQVEGVSPTLVQSQIRDQDSISDCSAHSEHACESSDDALSNFTAKATVCNGCLPYTGNIENRKVGCITDNGPQQHDGMGE
ncbi:hypothetical protein X943_003198 [Babesia divergens]|uniref:Uncharacterized protein n=1 Tax=Babesia divergens TaxID=32595 RepID=A0AAD9GHR6_BABDI|nr:hypothetical protein X943_003198 [Babesia divergens]